jgi:PAS domain S-box-containing protein
LIHNDIANAGIIRRSKAEMLPSFPQCARAMPDWTHHVRVDHIRGRVLVVLAPIIALMTATGALVLAALFLDSYRAEMFSAAAAVAVIALFLSVFLLYRQVRRRQAAGRALQDVEARVSDIVESAMDPVIAVNQDQRVVLFNAAAEKAFLWPRAAILGEPLDKLIPQRFRSAHREHIERFGDTGVTSRRMGSQKVLMALRADGDEFPIEASISQHTEDGKTLFTVILRDITDRVRADSLLARSEARLRGILDSAMDAIITIDESQHIVIFNAAAEAMFGCPKEEAVGAPLVWFIPQRFRGVHGDHVRNFGETGTASRRMGAQRIVTGVRRNGEEFPIDASISQVAERGSKYYTVILRDVTARVRAEEALRHSKEELQELGAAAHEAREQEKSRIARELHDELAQALTALQMDVAWCKEKLPAGQGSFAQKLDRMETLLDTTVTATRRIAADLRPLMLDDLGLLPAVEWLVENFTQRTGVPCELAVSTSDLRLNNANSTAVFRIVQESLANVAKHARASRAEVVIEQNGSGVTISVRDDGLGFSPQDPRKPNSFGLVGLRERAYLLGGEAAFISAPGRGTNIEVRLPVSSMPFSP